MVFNFIKPTVIFAIVGLIIPGLTAIGLLGFQMLLNYFGVKCPTAWPIIWMTTSIAGLILPFLFCRYRTRLTVDKLQSLKTRLILFNLFEYIFIQSSFTPLFISGKILCQDYDGKSGLELVFTT